MKRENQNTMRMAAEKWVRSNYSERKYGFICTQGGQKLGASRQTKSSLWNVCNRKWAKDV